MNEMMKERLFGAACGSIMTIGVGMIVYGVKDLVKTKKMKKELEWIKDTVEKYDVDTEK